MRRTATRLATLLLAALTGAAPPAEPPAAQPPPNAPSTVEWNSGRGELGLRYHDAVILQATVRAEDAAGGAAAGIEVKLEAAESCDEKEKVEQRLALVAARPEDRVKLVLLGTITGSEEGRDRELAGDRHGPHRPHRHQDRGMEAGFREMNARLLTAHGLAFLSAAFAADSEPTWQVCLALTGCRGSG
ncbi:MAG: hypothetical protein FJ290_27090 [Planctomycetes bacterium]|nr:hypothetical protein [Planctomycetota bacterium]